MKLEPLSLSTLIVAVPFVHVVVTAAYLLCYCFGFGANLSAFVSVEDIFTTSLANVAPIYLTGLLFPTLLSLWRHTWKYPYEADRIAAIEDPDRRSFLVRGHARAFRFTVVIVIIGSLVAFIGTLGKFLRAEHTFPQALVSMLAVGGFLLIVGFSQRAKSPIKLIEVGVVAVCFVSGALGSGISRGQSDRLDNYEYLARVRPMCGEYAVLRRISGDYLAAAPSGSRVLLTDACQPRIVFPEARPIGFLRWAWPPIVYYPSGDS